VGQDIGLLCECCVGPVLLLWCVWLTGYCVIVRVLCWSYVTVMVCVVDRVQCEIVKGDWWLHHVCLSVHRTAVPLDGFPYNFVEICLEN
jgi:hypothetical protein